MQQQPPRDVADATAAGERAGEASPAAHTDTTGPHGSDTVPTSESVPQPIAAGASVSAAADPATRAPQQSQSDVGGTQQQQQQQQEKGREQPSAASTAAGQGMAALFAGADMQEDLCWPQGLLVSTTCPSNSLNAPALAAAPPQLSPFSMSGLLEGLGVAPASLCDASSPAAVSSLSAASVAAATAIATAASSSAISRTSSSSSAAMQTGLAGSSGDVGDPQAALNLLAELGVNMESLQRLLTADCCDDFGQPVWMVVNLQGKIKGSYTPDKMLDFCRRGTLSSSQLLLGIDQNLPYLARQDLTYYRKLEELIKQVHAGFRYTPLTERTTATLNGQGLTGAHWQPLVPRDTPTSPGALHQQQQGGGAGPSEGGSGAAAAAQLRLALEKLCGCSVTEAMLNDPITAGGTAAALAAATAAAAAAAASAPPPSEAAGSQPPSTAEAAAAPAAGQDAKIDAAAAAAASAAVSVAAAVASGEAPTGTSSEDSKDPVWLYINHLGWCRGPFPGARFVQAHMCGRLPRDTLVAAHAPDVPSTAVSADIAYYFRPLGVLLDNVAKGWTYNHVTWSDVATKDLASTTMVLPAGNSWQPLSWKSSEPQQALVNPDQLLPPKSIPTSPQQQLPAGAGRGRARSVGGSLTASAAIAVSTAAVVSTSAGAAAVVSTSAGAAAVVSTSAGTSAAASSSTVTTSTSKSASTSTAVLSSSSYPGGRYGSRLARRAQVIMPAGWTPSTRDMPSQLQHHSAPGSAAGSAEQQAQVQPQQRGILPPPPPPPRPFKSPPLLPQQVQVQVQQQQQQQQQQQLLLQMQQQQQQQVQQQAQQAHGGVLLGHVQPQGNQPALPVLAPVQQLARPASQPQLPPLQAQQRQQVLLLRQQVPQQVPQQQLVISYSLPQIAQQLPQQLQLLGQPALPAQQSRLIPAGLTGQHQFLMSAGAAPAYALPPQQQMQQVQLVRQTQQIGLQQEEQVLLVQAQQGPQQLQVIQQQQQQLMQVQIPPHPQPGATVLELHPLGQQFVPVQQQQQQQQVLQQQQELQLQSLDQMFQQLQLQPTLQDQFLQQQPQQQVQLPALQQEGLYQQIQLAPAAEPNQQQLLLQQLQEQQQQQSQLMSFWQQQQ